MAGEATDKTGRFGGAGDLFTKAVKARGNGMTNEAAADRAEFIINPDGNVDTVGPEKNSAANEHQIAKDGEKTQRGTGTPNQADSFTLKFADPANSGPGRARQGSSGSEVTRA